ncbi:MAG: helix-turn-helix domain-containing protein [Coriobacteriales bacterium]|jgi:excisionase family DNA binding protein
MDDKIFGMSRAAGQGQFTRRRESRDNGTVNHLSSGTVAADDEEGRHTGTAQGDGRLLDVQEVAEYLRVSQSLVYKMIERKEIPAIRIGRLLRIDPRDLSEALRSAGRTK